MIQGQDTALTGGRGTPNVWSPASDTENWTQAVGSTPMSFSGSQLIVSGNNGNNVFWLGNTVTADQDILVRVTPSLATSNKGVILRAKDASNYYQATVVNGALTINKILNGASTQLANIPGAVDETQPYWVHGQVQGAGVNNIRACAFPDDGSGDPGFFAFASDASITQAGHFGLRAKCFSNGDSIAFDSFVAQDPPPVPTPPLNVSADSPYLLTLFVPQNNPPILSYQEVEDLTAIAPGLWLRYQLAWKNIEQSIGVYTWSVLDWAVSLCNTYGINLLYPIQTPPTWRKTIRASDGASVPAGTGDLPNAADTAAFASLIASRYNGQNGFGKLQGIGFNEDWDASGYAGVGNTSLRDNLSKWFAPVAAAVFPAIRAVYPNCIIGTAAVRKTPTKALQHVINWETNLYSTWQTLGFTPTGRWFRDPHYYRGGSSAGPDPSTSDANTPSIAQQLAAMRSVAASFGLSPEIWPCEFGYNMWDDGNGPQTTLSVSGALTAGTPITSLSVNALPANFPEATQITLDYNNVTPQETGLYAYGKALAGATSMQVTANPLGSGAAQTAFTPLNNHASGAKVYGFTSGPLYTPAQVEQYMGIWWNALKALGATKGGFYTYDVNATINRKKIPPTSTVVDSIVQKDNGVLVRNLAYSDPATGNGWKEYAAIYPSWPGNPSIAGSITSAAGNASVKSAQGQASVPSAQGKGSVGSAGGQGSVTSGTNTGSAKWEA